jgi:uncharacterized protein
MNAIVDGTLLQARQLQAHVLAATDRIAPTWPLDRFIAVNPYAGWTSQSWAEAAAMLGTLTGTALTLPREWFRTQWTAGRLQHRHLVAAVAAMGGERAGCTVADLLAALEQPTPPRPRLPLVTDLLDAAALATGGPRWSERVTHQVSQHCAAFFDRHQATWTLDAEGGLYGSWWQQLTQDRGLPWRRSRRAVQEQLMAMPREPRSLIAAARAALSVPEEGTQAYLTAVLMAMQGWAAWCAQCRWQARLQGGEDDHLEHLLAIRLAWEWLLHDDVEAGSVPAGWTETWRAADAHAVTLQVQQQTDLLLQRALELSYQMPLVAALQQPRSATPGVSHGAGKGTVADGQPAVTTPQAATPAVQAVFCIDVRSEVFRRALEAADPGVHTRGFAGFFGLPMSHVPLGTEAAVPRLPGLLAPALAAVDEVPADADDPLTGRALAQVLAQRRQQHLQDRQRWQSFRTAPSSAFTAVETLGLMAAPQLLLDSLPSTRKAARWHDAGLTASSAASLRPALPLVDEDVDAAAVLAGRILRAMGLVRDFAPLVLLVGHGSQSANNPHAAGLDCGACGGQTGEVSARVLADLLNRPTVRDRLRAQGIDIPAGTHVLPALHNTSTDDVELFDLDGMPVALQPGLQQLRDALHDASNRARAERAPGLGLQDLAGQPAALACAMRRRANDWAQVRPEWGLADNAALIVAPRQRTRHLNLGGRCFLHDYDHRDDADGAVLTLIMTAPMVVAHWINMQYHASTVDNARYGSGNKLLHNVVGGHLGVFEGNGGDLRIGLPLQSLHDGQHLRHTPLRLSVFIEAHQTAVDTVLADHPAVRDLVLNEWLHLLRIDPDTQHVEQRRANGWFRVASDDATG